MFKNHFKIALRNLLKRKAYSSINVIGLTVGIATVMVIFLVIRYENSYEDFNSRKDRIYRVVGTYSNRSNGEVTGRGSFVPIMLPDALRNDFPQLEKVAAIWNLGGAQIHIPMPGKDITNENKVKVSNGLFFVEPSLFDIFDYTWMGGSARGLTEPNTVVINQTLANQFFGNWKQAIGRTVEMWSFRVPLRVVGVFKDLPSNTDVEIRMGASYATHKKMSAEWFASNDWINAPWSLNCFLLLPKNTRGKQFNSQLDAFVNKYYPKELNGPEKKVTLAFQPLTDVHLNEDFNTYKGDALTHKELWSLALIGFFILFVACINFINLATAHSITRAKEIGVRKVIGSSRSQILKQFLNETFIITIIAVGLGCLVAKLCLPYIGNLMQKPLSLNILSSPIILAFLVILTLAVNMLAGFYPGVVLSRFNPIDAIKSKISTSNIGGISVRRGLVVLQFVIAQFLIIGTVVVIKQMQFFRNKSMGFEKNALALLELPSDSSGVANYNYLKDQMLKIPGVQAAAMCLDAPASFTTNNNTFYFNNEVTRKDFSVNLHFADTGYLNTFQIKLLAGRVPYPSDTMRELLVNETFVKKLGLTSANDIIGKTVSFDLNKKYPIVGVMHDFNNKSLKEAVAPFVLTTNSHGYTYIALRFDAKRMQPALAQVQRLFTKTYPTYIYDLNFVDEKIDQFYKTEAMASHLFKIASFLAIFISCLGLYGLVSFMAVQKTKEVGIRKVLGASIQNIVFLFSKEFTVLIGIAFLLAVPLGYFLMQRWLSGFYYHISINWFVFAFAIIISVIIAWITVGYKAIRAALANPVKSLRTE
ncbi:MAG: Acidobacterial duplicated orphan permease (function unknown) [uncultured Segetibacter sp.]|uniref:ABC transporter, permease protein n=1 Tax=uncultured Segetibacter sp. TaxID=481133 RepID=A0A6J4RLA5_9BACT|nr:MAG: Acidobacterial duplicated orphan permease (function unknown) [uncultured Segetibacter sp.]